MVLWWCTQTHLRSSSFLVFFVQKYYGKCLPSNFCQKTNIQKHIFLENPTPFLFEPFWEGWMSSLIKFYLPGFARNRVNVSLTFFYVRSCLTKSYLKNYWMDKFHVISHVFGRFNGYKLWWTLVTLCIPLQEWGEGMSWTVYSDYCPTETKWKRTNGKVKIVFAFEILLQEKICKCSYSTKYCILIWPHCCVCKWLN